MKWIKYHPRSPNRPKSGKPVLLHFAGGYVLDGIVMAPCIVVGYLKHPSGTARRFWITPGYTRVDSDTEPVYWSDCLGDVDGTLIWRPHLNRDSKLEKEK